MKALSEIGKDAEIRPILEILRKVMGLNASTIGHSTVENAVRRCMGACGAATVEEFMAMLAASDEIMAKLIEAVVIPETFFFRDSEPFEVVEKLVIRRLADHKPGPVRILSIPCSTGEEPYSIAMVLISLRLRKDMFQIDAVDISDQAIEIAKQGGYTAYSFRGGRRETTAYFFTKRGDNYHLHKEVRDSVCFQRGNLLDPSTFKNKGPYDIIFCRNLLIYFDGKSRAKAIFALSRLLADDGVLFVGHAETMALAESGFTQLPYPKAFAFAKRPGAEETRHEHKKTVKKYPSAKAAPAQPATRKKTGSPGKESAGKSDQAPAGSETFEERVSKARKLADGGSLQEASGICEKLLAEGYGTAQVYFLMGHILDAMGDPYGAEEYLKKAVYLDPGQFDAMLTLASIYEKIGDSSKAAACRRRAARSLAKAGAEIK